MEISNSNTLHYYVARAFNSNDAAFSLERSTSDITDNELVLKALVGTLVRSGPSGLVEPSLASRWEVTDDRRFWKFQLRNGLACDDGEPITAESFVHQLVDELRRISKKDKVMTFSSLRGWDEFIQKNKLDALGIKVSENNTISFEFVNDVGEFLDVLRMVRFGYWCKANSKIKDLNNTKHFVSSGPFTLKPSGSADTVLLERSKQWFEFNPRGFEYVVIKAVVIHPDQDLKGEYAIIRFGLFPPRLTKLDSFRVVRSAPNFLTSFTLSPLVKNGLFRIPSNRVELRNRILSFKYPDYFEKIGLYQSHFLYDSAKSTISRKQVAKSKLKYNGQLIRVRTPFRFGNEVSTHFTDLIYSLLPEVPPDKILFNDTSNMTDVEYMAHFTANDYFDIRISSVDLHPTITIPGSGIEMMFCTKLGVSFPDIYGTICSLAKKYIKSGKQPDDYFIKTFNQALFDEAMVVPYFHSGITWVYSNNINPAHIPVPAVGFPIFERLQKIE